MVYTASDDKMSECLNGKDTQGSCNGLIWGNIFAFARREWKIP